MDYYAPLKKPRWTEEDTKLHRPCIERPRKRARWNIHGLWLSPNRRLEMRRIIRECDFSKDFRWHRTNHLRVHISLFRARASSVFRSQQLVFVYWLVKSLGLNAYAMKGITSVNSQEVYRVFLVDLKRHDNRSFEFHSISICTILEVMASMRLNQNLLYIWKTDSCLFHSFIIFPSPFASSNIKGCPPYACYSTAEGTWAHSQIFFCGALTSIDILPLRWFIMGIYLLNNLFTGKHIDKSLHI